MQTESCLANQGLGHAATENLRRASVWKLRRALEKMPPQLYVVATTSR
jgi:hypothetical protein